MPFEQFPSWQCGFDPHHRLQTRIPSHQNRIGGLRLFVDLCFGPCSGHFRPHISTPRDSPFSFRKTLSSSRHVLRLSGSPVRPTSPKSCLRHNYEVDVNGANYDAAKKLDQW